MSYQPKENKTRKLTQLQVEEIRQWAAKGATQSSLCRHYGVTIGTIGRIVRGESWVASIRPIGPSPAEHDATLARLLATQRQKDLDDAESPELRAMAQDFKAFLDEPRAQEPQREFVYPPRVDTRDLLDDGTPAAKIPLSPLDGGDLPDAVEGAVDVLQDKARAQGVDIDELLNK